jgi:cytosine/uracil/thiamine/allantoin permease
VLVVDDLYLRGGIYEYSRGFNWLAVIALAGSGHGAGGIGRSSAAGAIRLFVVRGICGGVCAYYALMKQRWNLDLCRPDARTVW